MDESEIDKTYLRIIDVKTKKKSERLAEVAIAHGYANWNSDNKIYFTYVKGKLGDSTVYISRINPDGTGLKHLAKIENCYGGAGLNLVSPKGDRIVFGTSQREDILQPYIWIVDTSGKNIKKIGKGVAVSFSYDGTKIAFERREDTNKNGVMENKDISQIFIYDLETGEEKKLTEYGDNSGALFFWDNKRIIYLAEEDLDKDGEVDHRDNYKIYTMNIDGSDQRRLTTGEAHESFIGISPKGDYLFVESAREDTNDDSVIDIWDDSSIYLVDFNGKDLKELARHELGMVEGIHIYFFPDTAGKYVAFEALAPEFESFYPEVGFIGRKISNIYTIEIKIKEKNEK